ncbi:MAG: PIN domain-containing protein [Chloroflexi bacterium]|nr:PIN domain-containing protein [Chloroflexota bacterium]
MKGTYTVDASVFLNAFNPQQTGYEVSYRLLYLMHQQAIPIIVPTLLLPEIAATIGRGRRDPVLARQFTTTLSHLPHMVLVPLDLSLAQQAVEVAADYHLRGSDAVYVAVALRFSSILVTLDREQQTRAAGAVAARSPADILNQE